MCCVTVINIWRDEIARREYLREYFVNKKVALDLRVHSRAIENRIARTIRLHLRNRKWIPNNIFCESSIDVPPPANASEGSHAGKVITQVKIEPMVIRIKFFSCAASWTDGLFKLCISPLTMILKVKTKYLNYAKKRLECFITKLVGFSWEGPLVIDQTTSFRNFVSATIFLLFLFLRNGHGLKNAIGI